MSEKDSRVLKNSNEKEEISWRYIKPVEGEMAFEKYPEMLGKCTGCGICEAVCSLQHFGVVSLPFSAIKVEKNYYDWMNRTSPHLMAISRTVCHQCPGQAACIMACPVNALSRVDGMVKLDKEKCTKCGKCVKACPYNAITFARKELIKCDLCGGDPQCVKFCPPRVLQYVVEKK